MLQISQTENPICSATIDQMRFRRATNLPLEFQNVSSSGFQAAIQGGFCSLIRDFLFLRVPPSIAHANAETHAGKARKGGVDKSDDGFRRTASLASALNIQ